MTGLLMLTGVAALAALVFVMLAYNHRAELDRRRTVRRAGQALLDAHDRYARERRQGGRS